MSSFCEEQQILYKNRIFNVYPKSLSLVRLVYSLPRVKLVGSYIVRYLLSVSRNKKRNLYRLLANKSKVLIIEDFDNKNLIHFNVYSKIKTTLWSNMVVTLHKRCFFNIIILLTFIQHKWLLNVSCLYSLRTYLVLKFNNQGNFLSIFCCPYHVWKNIMGVKEEYQHHQSVKTFIGKIKKRVNLHSDCLLNTFMQKSNNSYNKVSLCFFVRANRRWKALLKT